MFKKMLSLMLFSSCVFSASFAAAPKASSVFSNIYVKGEVGYSFSNKENFSVEQPQDFWTQPGDDFSDKIGHSWLYSVGLGYVFNPYLSSDITYALRDGFSYDKTFSSADRKREFDVKNQTAMLSLYLQANSQNNSSIFNRLHPFVGAGVGCAWNKTKNFKSTVISTGGTQGADQNGNEKTNFAWQAMAGVSYDITKSLMADLGYRYVNIGKISTGELRNTDAPTADPLSASRSDLQEAFLSLRYVI